MTEAGFRLTVFLGVLVAMALWELAMPRRPLATSKLKRWGRNLSVVLVDTVLVRALFAAGAVSAAFVAAERQIGLFNQLHWPILLKVVLAVIALDFALYLQHVMFHAIPLLWRLHLVHHTDLDFDVTTGVRFHPFEVSLSMLIKLAAIGMLGPPPVSVLIFEILLNASSLFNHGNVRIPAAIDRALRWLIVTPDMHRIHHSIDPGETNRNFGFNLPWWDRLLGTYCAMPARSQQEMALGLEHYREDTALTLPRILVLPFTAHTGRYPLSRGAQRPG